MKLYFVMHPQYQKIVDAEWDILYDKLERIHKSGAKVVLSKLPIGDVATQVMNSMTHRIPQHANRVLIDFSLQYFADRDMFCAGRVTEEDLNRTMKACGGSIQTTVHDLNDATLGLCETFEEKQVSILAHLLKTKSYLQHRASR